MRERRAIDLNVKIREHRQAEVVVIRGDERLLGAGLHGEVEGEPSETAAPSTIVRPNDRTLGRLAVEVGLLLLRRVAWLHYRNGRHLESPLTLGVGQPRRNARIELRRGEHIEIDAVRSFVGSIKGVNGTSTGASLGCATCRPAFTAWKLPSRSPVGVTH